MPEQPQKPEIPELEAHRKLISLLAESQLNRSLRSKVDPDDMVQETMRLASEQFSELSDSGNATAVKSWLVKILSNVIIDEYRKYNTEKRDINLERSIADELDHSSACIEGWIAAQQTSPSMAAARNEELAKLEEGLKRLPEDERHVIVQRHLKNKSLQEIADSMERTVPSVAGLLRRGLARLRTGLA